MRCSALRETKQGIKPCGQLGKPEHDGFCSHEHHQQAKKYAGLAYDTHVANYVKFSGQKDLFRIYNDDLRPVFQSVIEAGKKHEREQLLKTIGVEYASMAKSAWQTVDAVKNEVGQLLEPTVREARSAVKNAKRVRQHTSLNDIVRSATDDEEEEPSYHMSGSPKKSRPPPLSPRHVPLPDASNDNDLESSD